ncbi:MAG: LysR substrate-binding domain-containing protein [Acidobacteriaceae bacterium]
MEFDLVDLELFINIAEGHSLTHGAQRSHMAVPTASLRIKNIEDRLSAELFYRTHHGLVVAPAGNVLLGHARSVLRELQSLKSDLQEYSKNVNGHLGVAASITPATDFLPAVLHKYLKSHPNVRVDLRELLSQDIVRAVSDGASDIGIVADGVSTHDLETIAYRQYRHVLITTLDHPLADRAAVDFGETLDCDYVGLLEGSVTNTFLRQIASRLNKDLKLRLHVRTFEALCRMVEINVGIGILPELAARRHSQTMKIRIVKLNDAWAVRKLKVCVRNLHSLPSFARALVDLLVVDRDGDVCAQHSGASAWEPATALRSGSGHRPRKA